MEPDDVVIADTAGQARDIFLHSPESAHRNGIVKTFSHTSNPIHPCMPTPRKRKRKTKSKTLNSPNKQPSFTGPLPVQSGGGRRPGSLAPAPAPHDCPTSQAFSPGTVLTRNICRRAQQIFQHRPPTIPFLTNSTITFPVWLH